MSYIYLASPYSHPNPMVQEFRYLAAMDCTRQLLQNHRWVYSPIVHCHVLAHNHGMPTDAEFWRDYNEAMISTATELVILGLPDWEKSTGVRFERTHAIALGIPTSLIIPEVTPYVEVLRKLAA